MRVVRRARASAAADFTLVAEIFKALADPVRLKILHQLSAADACVHELCAMSGMSQPSVSHHLRLLRSARLVATRRAGREIFYALTDDHVTTMVEAARRHTQEH